MKQITKKYYAWRIQHLYDKAMRRRKRFYNPTVWYMYLTKHEKNAYTKLALKLYTENYTLD